jgi:hypothetical protein
MFGRKKNCKAIDVHPADMHAMPTLVRCLRIRKNTAEDRFIRLECTPAVSLFFVQMNLYDIIILFIKIEPQDKA